MTPRCSNADVRRDVLAVARMLRRVEDRYELKCAHCRHWWPLDPEFWGGRRLSRCRACIREAGRLREQSMTQDEVVRHQRNAIRRAWYWSLTPEERRIRLDKNAAWRAAHPDRTRANNRAYYARNRARLLAAQKAYDDEARDVIRLKRQHRKEAA